MIGKVINKYRFDEKLGEGGMGVVYKAWDVDLERPVALKMLHPVFSQDATFLKRFRAEARALAQLDNPHIVTVYDLQKTEDGLFIVMQYVEGVTLAGKLEKSGPLPSAEALTIFKQLLEALSHAHQAHIIHRDVKPSNVMLNQQGLVKVTDFGLAKIPYDSVLTQSRSIGGTLLYMSPEHIRSMASVDARSDIYSAGMTLYEMLAGRLPFEKHENIYTLPKLIVEGNFLPPDQHYAEVSKELSKIVMRAIAKEPENRYQSAVEMSEAIKHCETADEGTRTLSPFLPTPRPTLKMGRLVIAAISFLVFAAIIFFVFFSPALRQHFPGFWANSASAALSISTNPDSAAVFLNENFLGFTPLIARPAKTGERTLRLQKANYRTIDTVVVIAPGRETTLAFFLQAIATRPESVVVAPEFGAAQILSQPAGADIFLDNQRRGKTPITIKKLAPGDYIIVLKKADYQDSSISVAIEAGKEKKVEVKLAPLMGKLRVVVKPFGSVFIDGKRRMETAVEPYEIGLPVGPHLVKITHPSFGYWEKEIEIKPDSLFPIQIDFEKLVKLTVAAEGVEWAYIYVDGIPTNKQTTSVVTLRVGKHKIEVRREGYELVGGGREINLEKDDRLVFTLKKLP